MDPKVLRDVCQQTQQIPLLVFAWTLLCAAILITALRLYSKSKQCHGITVDDYIALASTILAAVAVSFLTVWIHSGLGRHLQCVDDPRITLLWSLLTQVLSIIGICLIKISVCFCIRRVVDGASSPFRSLILILILFIIASHTAHVVLLFLECRPLDVLWSANSQTSNCFTRQQLSLIYYIGYSLDAFTDLICASIPVAIIRHGHLSNRSRIGFGVLIGFGTLIAGCAIVKTVTLIDAFTADYTWESSVPVWFEIAEYYGGIVIASIPSLAGLFARSANHKASVYDGAGSMSLRSVSRKGTTWTAATPRIPLAGAAKKHFSISTFGMSEGEVGSRVTIVDNRLTVVDDDGSRLTRVAEEGDGELDRATFDYQRLRTATPKSGQMGWNKEDVFGLGMLGRHDTFGRDGSRELREGTYADSISSIGRVTRPNTPRRPSISLQPTTPGIASGMSSSRLGSPKSPGFPLPQTAQRMPKSPLPRRSVASSLYSEIPASAGLPPIPSPPPNVHDLPFIFEASSRPTTPRTPKTPTWTTSPSGFKSIKSPKAPHTFRSNTPTGLGSRTPQGSSTPRGGSRPGTPKRSLSVTVPVSKFQAEMSGALGVGETVNKPSHSGRPKSKVLPRPPLEIRVLDIPPTPKFDSLDASY